MSFKASCGCRAALLQMASSLKKQGELGDAQDYCLVRRHTIFLSFHSYLLRFWVSFDFSYCTLEVFVFSIVVLFLHYDWLPFWFWSLNFKVETFIAIL